MSPERRVVALVLPDLLCELAEAREPFRAEPVKRATEKTPFAVVWALEAPTGDAPQKRPSSERPPTDDRLVAVSEAARRAGAHVGQRAVEAQAELAHLAVLEVSRTEVREALERVAEVSLAFGAPVGIEMPDTVWVDITGAAHLWGGERELAEELASRVRGLGVRSQLAVASGPHLARAFAQWELLGPEGVCVVSERDTVERFGKLPLCALPLDAERLTWFSRLGLLEVRDLTRLPSSALAARLGPLAGRVLGLLAGQDPAPLVAYEPPRVLREQSSWEEPVSGTEPLLFVLRGLLGRISARLEGRGEAAQALEVRLFHDRAIAEHRGVAREHELRFDLVTPLWREMELERVVRSRLERTELAAPTLGVEVVVPQLSVAPTRQLELAEGASQRDELPVLLAELGADVGAERVGVLTWVDHHCPESQSRLEPVRKVRSFRGAASSASPLRSARGTEVFTRLLPEPLQLSAQLRLGETLAVGPRLYCIEQMRFVERLEGVGWWTSAPASRDYLRLWLRGPDGGLDALVFVDRATGKRYLQAFAD